MLTSFKQNALVIDMDYSEFNHDNDQKSTVVSMYP